MNCSTNYRRISMSGPPKLLVLFGVLVGFCYAQDTSDTPGFQFLGFGYDSLLGNTLATTGLGDDGFRTNIFKFTHNEGQKTTDGKWDIPDKTTSQAFTACAQEEDMKIIDSLFAYTKTVEDTLDLDAGGAGVTAGFSVDSKNVEASTHNHTSIFAHISYVCAVYELTVHEYDSPALDENFVKGVQSLPTTYDEEAYMSFILEFGTHVVHSLKAGGRWGWQTEFKEDSFVSMLDYGVDVNLGLNYAGKIQAGIAFNHSADTSTINAVTSAIYKNSTFNIGGEFNPNPEQWMKNLQNNPMPVHLGLTSLDKFLTPLYLPDQDDVDAKADGMRTALDSYCAYRQKNLDPDVSCEAPQPVPPPQPHPVADNAIRQVCVENEAGFVLYFMISDVDSSTGIEATSDRYPIGRRECVDAYLLHADRNDRVKCTVQAIAGKRQDCEGDQWYPYDQRAQLRAVYKCTGATLTYSCAFQGLEAMYY